MLFVHSLVVDQCIGALYGLTFAQFSARYHPICIALY